MWLSEQQIHALMIAAANKRLKYRSWLLDAFTVCKTYTHKALFDVSTPKIGDTVPIMRVDLDSDVGLGSIVQIQSGEMKFVGVVIEAEAEQLGVSILSDGTTPVFPMMGCFDLPAGKAIQYFDSHPFTQKAWGPTTVGRFVTNMVCMQYPFDFNVFEYINSNVKPEKLSNMVKDKLLANQVTVEEFERFWDYMYFIGHLSELVVPSMTVKSLQTSPKVPELKRAFIEEHKDQMNDPLVIQKLEELLINADKEYLGDDESTVFFDGLGGKSYALHRKKLFLTVGGIPAFDTDTAEMDFIPNSLSEGWMMDKLPSIANEVRKGSYSRGVETAKGGAETKLIWRAFGDITIPEDDCGTKRTISVDCSRFDAKQFIGRTIRVNGMDIKLDPDNYKRYAEGQVIHLYSPLTCATKHNFCYKCCGERARQLGAKQLGVQTIKITSTFMGLSMSNMHGTVLAVQDNKLEDILL